MSMCIQQGGRRGRCRYTALLHMKHAYKHQDMQAARHSVACLLAALFQRCSTLRLSRIPLPGVPPTEHLVCVFVHCSEGGGGRGQGVCGYQSLG